jgi:putative ABC transport system substrate-binding protein
MPANGLGIHFQIYCAYTTENALWRLIRSCLFICATVFAVFQTPALANRVAVIGETKIASHAALDADQQGFTAGLAASGFIEGDNLIILREDAQGSIDKAREIAKEFVERKVDLIHTISTPSTVLAMQTGALIPIVFSSVTDPVSAGSVQSPRGFRTVTGNHVTGVSDLWPVALQMRLYKRMYPSATAWGTIYNPAEPNSVLHVTKMRKAANDLGITLVEATVTNSDQVPNAARSLLGKVQALMITSDNTTVKNLHVLTAFAQTHGIPLFAGDVDSVRGGAVAAYGMDYFLVGYAAGRKAGLILQGVKPGDIPWGPLEKFSFVVNLSAAKRQGVEITPSVLAIADEVIQ